jgi:general secretion pathway protein J
MTLIEVMVAIMVLTVMSVVVFQTLTNTAEMDELLGDRDETTRAARVALGRLQREIQLAWLTPNRDAALTYQTVFVGVDDSPDTLTFATLAHERLYLNTRECDQAEITVWAEAETGRGSRGFTLYHRESARIDEKPDEDGVIRPLAQNVRSFDIRYLNSQTNEWVEEWDTRGVDTPYRLPRVVELSLVLIGRDPEDRERTIDVPFLTRVRTEFSPVLMNAANPVSLLTWVNGGMAGGIGGMGVGGGMPLPAFNSPFGTPFGTGGSPPRSPTPGTPPGRTGGDSAGGTQTNAFGAGS